MRDGGKEDRGKESQAYVGLFTIRCVWHMQQKFKQVYRSEMHG